jgi:hypothetical protein
VHDRARIVAQALLAVLLFAACGQQRHALDLDGHEVDPFDDEHAVTALVFVSTECPISNRYAPELKRIAELRAARGANLWLVFPDAQDDAAEIRAHLQSFSYGLRVVRDPEHVLVKRAGVGVTPEVAVFAQDGSLAYRGRIDDRYASFGQERPSAQTHDLEAALTAVLQGRPVAVATTTAVGCAISD